MSGLCADLGNHHFGHGVCPQLMWVILQVSLEEQKAPTRGISAAEGSRTLVSV